MKVIITPNELMDKGLWDKFCDLKGWNVYAVNEGLVDGEEQITLTSEESKALNLIKE